MMKTYHMREDLHGPPLVYVYQFSGISYILKPALILFFNILVKMRMINLSYIISGFNADLTIVYKVVKEAALQNTPTTKTSRGKKTSRKVSSTSHFKPACLSFLYTIKCHCLLSGSLSCSCFRSLCIAPLTKVNPKHKSVSTN